MTTTPRPDLVPVSVPASTAASFITARSLDPGQTLEDDGTQPTKGTIWELSHTPVAATITYTTRKGTPLHTTKGTTTAQEDTLNLWAIGVDKAWQNQGIAHKTITHLQQKAQAEASTLIIHSVGSQQLKHILRTMKYQETRDGRWSTFKAQNQNPTTKPQHTPTTPPRRPLPHPTTTHNNYRSTPPIGEEYPYTDNENYETTTTTTTLSYPQRITDIQMPRYSDA